MVCGKEQKILIQEVEKIVLVLSLSSLDIFFSFLPLITSCHINELSPGRFWNHWKLH